MDSFYIFLDEHPWISILVFFALQFGIFLYTIIKLLQYRRFFPKDGNWRADIYGDSYQIELPESSENARELVREVNEYLAKNEGTTDFGIIKDKTERKLETLYEDAMSKISYPTYLGLMGTFFGVFIGLKSFNIGVAKAGVNDSIVSQLIGGIIVSMVTSLFGLALMMIGNWIASSFQKKVEADKNKFYDFLQVELMPVLGTSMVAALHKLHKTINKFEPAFRSVINEFKTAFGECTETLRDTFGEKVQVLTNAVDAMGKNMTLINENVQRQDELLKTLRQKQTLETLEKFTEAADKFDSVTATMVKLNEVKDDIAASSEVLVKAQTEYVEQMAIPERVFEKINAILSRITTFEDSINTLGKDIAQTQLMGNKEMNLIEEQITAIKKKTNLAIAYQETTDEQLKEIYKVQAKAIDDINAKYRTAIQEHGDDFEAAMVDFKAAYVKIVNECKQAVEDKREEFIKEIKKSINIEQEVQHLAQLEMLPGLKESLVSILDTIKDKSAVLSKLDELKKSMASIPSQPNGSSMTGNTVSPYGGVSRPYIPSSQPASPQPQQSHSVEESNHAVKKKKKRGGIFSIFRKH